VERMFADLNSIFLLACSGLKKQSRKKNSINNKFVLCQSIYA
jgi:hypothetical protein